MRIIESIIEQNIDDLEKDFELYSKRKFYDKKSKKLIHPGEYGIYRGRSVSKFLKNFLPKNYAISTGFIVNNIDEISTQCDLIINYKDLTPLISDYINQEFYTAETVVAIGEIKSTLNKSDLKKALNKLAKCKRIKDNTLEPQIYKSNNSTFNPSKQPYDTTFTFLVCEKLDFNTDNLLDELSGYYDQGINNIHKHNMIYSLKDGLFTYYKEGLDGKSMTIHYPNLGEEELKNLLIQDEDKYVPAKLFGSYFFQAIISHTILVPDLIRYNIKYESQILKFEK